MSKLTAKQEKYCQEYIKCGNQSEAYRNSYAVKKATKPDSVYQQACALMADPRISSRVYELQQLVQERTLVTTESLTEELNKAIIMATSLEQASALTGAIMGKAKLNGLDINKTQISGADGGPIETKTIVFNPVSNGN